MNKKNPFFRVFDLNNSSRVTKDEWMEVIAPDDSLTFAQFNAFITTNQAKACYNPIPDFKYTSDSDIDSDNSVSDSEMIPASTAISQPFFNKDNK